MKPIPGGCNISSTPSARATSTSRPKTATPGFGIPQHRWVYDKIAIAQSQGLEAAPAWRDAAALSGVLEADHQSQRHGRSAAACCARRATTRKPHPRPYVDDAARGPPCRAPTSRSSMASRAGGGMSPASASGEGPSTTGPCMPRRMPAIEDYCGAWISRASAGYTGILNIETIGGRMIEVHLRMSDQWPDLYGAGWVEAVVRLYDAARLGFCRSRPARRLQRRAVRPARAALPPSAAGAGRAGAQHARRVQRADHLPRGQGPCAARHAARRLPPRDRQRLGSAGRPRRPRYAAGHISSPRRRDGSSSAIVARAKPTRVMPRERHAGLA